MSNNHQSQIAKRIALIAESSEMEDIIKAFDGDYDIEAALYDLDLKLKFKDTEGKEIEADDTEVWLDDDGIRYTIEYQAKGYLVPGESSSRISPGNPPYFEEVYHILDIDDLNKQFLQAGLLAKWKVDDEFAYGQKMVNGKFQKVKNDYEDAFCEFATENFAEESLGLRKLVRDEYGSHYDPVAPINVEMEFDIELADFAAFGAFLMTFKRTSKEVKEKEVMTKKRSLTEVGPRKPRVTSSDLAASMPHSKIKVPTSSDANEGAWKDAEDMASQVGYDKVWHTTVTGQGEWGDWEYGRTWYSKFPMFFYAFDKEDALDRLNVFKDKKFAGKRDSYKLSDPVEIDALAVQKAINTYNTYASDVEKLIQANSAKRNAEQDYDKRNQLDTEYAKQLRELSDKFREAAKPYEYQNGEYYAPYNEKFCTHILAIPTKKMLDEMVKSADWAVALVQKLHDQDEAKLKEQWLKTPDGKKWQRKFDEEKLAATRRAERESEKQRIAQEAEVQSEEIAKCLNGQSQDFSQYNNLGVVPVEVIGGKKFRGKGFVYTIESVESNYGYNSYDNYTDLAKIFIPSRSSEEFATANLKYCRIDTSVTPTECKNAFGMWCQAKVNSTLEWCRSKQPSKPESEIQSWAANIVKKHAPMIDIQTYFPSLNLANAEDDRVKSTVQWAMSLGYPQDKTNFIIGRALAKKGIKPADHKDTIRNQLEMKFGKSTFQF